MDLIKETHDLLTHYLGKEHRGRKQLGPEWNELKKDIQSFVLYAMYMGKAVAASDMQILFDQHKTALDSAVNSAYAEFRKKLNEPDSYRFRRDAIIEQEVLEKSNQNPETQKEGDKQ